MHLNITYTFTFELLLLESIVYLHLKDCVVVPKKEKEICCRTTTQWDLLESIFSFHFLMIKPQAVFNREIFPRD